jgi:hypothetical protein
MVRQQSADTSHEAEAFLIDRYRAMTPAQKLEQFRALCRTSQMLAAAGIRHRDPSASEQDVLVRLAAMRLPAALVRQLEERRRADALTEPP